VMFADEGKITKIMQHIPVAHCFGGQNSPLLHLSCGIDIETFLAIC